MTDPSLSNHDLKTPDVKVSTRYFNVEHVPKWGRLGEVDHYFWKTPNEVEPKEIELYFFWFYFIRSLPKIMINFP